MRVTLIALVLVALHLGCRSEGCADLEKDPAFAELRIVQRADPREALKAALSRHDLRFLSIVSFSGEVPGIDPFPDETFEALTHRFGVREIYGPGDVGPDVDLLKGARTYAGRYNRLLLEWLRRSGKTNRVDLSRRHPATNPAQ